MKNVKIKSLTALVAVLFTTALTANTTTGEFAVSGTFNNEQCTLTASNSLDIGTVTLSDYIAMPTILWTVPTEGVNYKNTGTTTLVTVNCPTGIEYDFELNATGESVSTTAPGARVALFATWLSTPAPNNAQSTTLKPLGSGYRLNGIGDGTDQSTTFEIGLYIADTESAPTDLAATVPYIFTSN